MALDPTQIETRIEELTLRLACLEQRLDRLEAPPGRRAARTEDASAPEFVEDDPEAAAAAPRRSRDRGGHSTGTVPLVGRTLVVLGGAFLIRAITEGRVIPDTAGVALGIAYGLSWLLFADRAGRARVEGATYHGLAAALILFPLVWESTISFHYLSPETSALVLAAAGLAALAVSTRQRLRLLAWLFTSGAAGLAIGLAARTQAPYPYGGTLLLLGLGTLWHGYLTGSPLLARVTAGLVDLWIFILAALALLSVDVAQGAISGTLALVMLQLGLVFVYLGSFGLRTLIKGREVTIGEIIQSAGVTAIGFGGAIVVAHHHGTSTLLVDLASLVMGAFGYGVAFAFIERRSGRGRNFFFYSSFAVVFTAVALFQFLSGTLLTAALCACAAGTAALGFLRRRVTLSLHAAAYATFAAAASGLLARAASSLFGVPVPGPGTGAMTAVVLAVTAALVWLSPPWRDRETRRLSLFPGMTALALLAAGVGGMVVRLLAAAGVAGLGAEAVLVLRAAVLSVTAVSLAALAGIDRFREVRWVVYAILVSAGLRMIVQDLLTRRSAVIFISLALYGGALILAPRLLRSRHTAA